MPLGTALKVASDSWVDTPEGVGGARDSFPELPCKTELVPHSGACSFSTCTYLTGVLPLVLRVLASKKSHLNSQ